MVPSISRPQKERLILKKKDSEITAAEVKTGLETNEPAGSAEKTDYEASGVYVYLGPTVKGIVTNGSIMRGTKNSVMEYIAQRAETVGLKEKAAKIGRLMIKDRDGSAAREQIRTGGNGLSRAYEAVLSAENGGEK